jgi:hypothetical protein
MPNFNHDVVSVWNLDIEPKREYSIYVGMTILDDDIEERLVFASDIFPIVDRITNYFKRKKRIYDGL